MRAVRWTGADYRRVIRQSRGEGVRIVHDNRDQSKVASRDVAEGLAVLEPELGLFTQGREPDLEVTLPWPPSVNRYWGHRPLLPRMSLIAERIKLKGLDGFYQWLRKATHVRDYLKPDGEVFREESAWLFKAKGKRFGSVNCAVWLQYHPPRHGAVDIFNFDKGILDSAQWASVVDNDAQFVVGLVTKGEVVKDGLVDVRIWVLG